MHPLSPLVTPHLFPLAQGAGAIDSVPAEFIKYFVMVSAFLIGNYLMLRKAGAAGGQANDPVHLKTPIETKKTPIYADKVETSEAITRLNLRLEQLEQRISSNYNEIVNAGQKRAEKLTDSIHEVKDDIIEKIDQSLKEAYSRINEQDTRLSRVEGQLSITKRPRD